MENSSRPSKRSVRKFLVRFSIILLLIIDAFVIGYARLILPIEITVAMFTVYFYVSTYLLVQYNLILVKLL